MSGAPGAPGALKPIENRLSSGVFGGFCFRVAGFPLGKKACFRAILLALGSSSSQFWGSGCPFSINQQRAPFFLSHCKGAAWKRKHKRVDVRLSKNNFRWFFVFAAHFRGLIVYRSCLTCSKRAHFGYPFLTPAIWRQTRIAAFCLRLVPGRLSFH